MIINNSSHYEFLLKFLYKIHYYSSSKFEISCIFMGLSYLFPNRSRKSFNRDSIEINLYNISNRKENNLFNLINFKSSNNWTFLIENFNFSHPQNILFFILRPFSFEAPRKVFFVFKIKSQKIPPKKQAIVV